MSKHVRFFMAGLKPVLFVAVVVSLFPILIEFVHPVIGIAYFLVVMSYFVGYLLKG